MITKIDDRIALILIDLQKGTTAGIPKETLKIVVENSNRLANGFRKAGQPVVIVHVNPIGEMFTKIRTEEFHNRQGEQQPPPEFTELLSEVTVEEQDILITKKVWNAFFDTGLHQRLDQKGVSQIILGGVSTSMGVEGTARAAAERGYNIVFAIDAMADRVASSQQNSFTNIFPYLGELGTTGEILSRIRTFRKEYEYELERIDLY